MDLLVNVHAALMQDEPARVVLVHQRNVVGRDYDRRSRFVEFDEQAQQPLRQVRIDVAGGLVGEQELRSRNHSACDGGALLLSTGKHRRQCPEALAKPDPLQQFIDLLPVG